MGRWNLRKRHSTINIRIIHSKYLAPLLNCEHKKTAFVLEVWVYFYSKAPCYVFRLLLSVAPKMTTNLRNPARDFNAAPT